MISSSIPRWSFVVAGALAVAAGCGRSRPTQFYLLTPVATAADRGHATESRGRVIGVAPVVLPRYLDRAQIVTRTGDHSLHVAEFHRWGEPLDGAFGRILVENLSRLRPEQRFVLLPWQGVTPPEARLWLEVLRFDRGPDDHVHLMARWMVSDRDGKELVPLTSTELAVPVEQAGYDATAAAMSRVVGELARAIAAAIPS